MMWIAATPRPERDAMKAGISLLLLLGLLLTGNGLLAEEDAPPPPPAAGTMRFSTRPGTFPEDGATQFGAGQTIYALAGFEMPLRAILQHTDEGTHLTVILLKGDRTLARSVFYPTAQDFDEPTLRLEIVPDPATTNQFNYPFPRALAALEEGKHALRVKLWTMHGKVNDLAQGRFTFVADAASRQDLLDRTARILKAKETADPKPRPEPLLVHVRHDGADSLQIRGDEIIKDGAVVGTFDDGIVRRGGAVVGEIRGTTFRHQGAKVWSLDRGNLHAGLEIRFEGAILGAIEEKGRIVWDGETWGAVTPYAGKEPETMRIVAALYYFSDYFRRQ